MAHRVQPERPGESAYEGDERALASEDVWWFQPEYTGPLSFVHGPVRGGNDQLPWVRKARARLDKHPYGDVLGKAFLRYIRALDQTDYESGFLALWGVLETLTDTTKRKNEQAAERALNLFRDREFFGQVLKLLLNHRNRAVHAGVESDYIETLVYQLKLVVEVLLRFHLDNLGRFSTLREAADFLDLPTDLATVRQRIRNLKRWERWLEPKQKRGRSHSQS